MGLNVSTRVPKISPCGTSHSRPHLIKEEKPRWCLMPSVIYMQPLHNTERGKKTFSSIDLQSMNDRMKNRSFIGFKCYHVRASLSSFENHSVMRRRRAQLISSYVDTHHFSSSILFHTHEISLFIGHSVIEF